MHLHSGSLSWFVIVLEFLESLRILKSVWVWFLLLFLLGWYLAFVGFWILWPLFYFQYSPFSVSLCSLLMISSLLETLKLCLGISSSLHFNQHMENSICFVVFLNESFPNSSYQIFAFNFVVIPKENFKVYCQHQHPVCSGKECWLELLK